ncbi:MAG: hypothetical protein JRI89_17020 [Deltaproteobacteria bacterium]|nr:hypothetical protein [Deltaproteobacteria bacterium]
MHNTARSLPLLILAVVILQFLASGCVPSKQARIAAVAHTMEDVARAAAKQSDLTIIQQGTPAYLMLVDGLIEAYPQDKRLLVAGAQAYTQYAAAFMEDAEPAVLSGLYSKAKQYGFRALTGEKEPREVAVGTLQDYNILLSRFNKEDVPALFWTTSAWAGWIRVNLNNLEALAQLPYLEASMSRLLELDDTYHYGGPHLLLASYLAAKPAILGGDIEKANEHFQRAFALGKGKLLMAKVLYAQYYARRLGSKSLFQHTLEEVLAAPVDSVPELTLANTLAKRKAEQLLEKTDEYFAEMP